MQDFQDDERDAGNLKPWLTIRGVCHRPIPESPVSTIQSKIEKSKKLIDSKAAFRVRDVPLLTKSTSQPRQTAAKPIVVRLVHLQDELPSSITADKTTKCHFFAST
jgi:hypothetical protein